MSVLIDVPQIAYKTWTIEYRMYDNNGNRMFELEFEAEQDLKRCLFDYGYSSEHEHVR